MNRKAFSPSILLAMALVLLIAVAGLAQVQTRNSGLTLGPLLNLNARTDGNLQHEASTAQLAELSKLLSEVDINDMRFRTYGQVKAAESSVPQKATESSVPISAGGFAEIRPRNYGPEQAAQLSEPLADGGFAELRARNYAPEPSMPQSDGGFAELRARNYAPEPSMPQSDGGFAELRARNYAPEQ